MVILVPDGVFLEDGVRTGVSVGIEGETIAWVGETPPAGADVIRLPGRLLLPGFVNAHSHAFQRAIRGRSEFRQPGREKDDFWTWREVMYRAALELSPDDVEAISRMAFLEMALAGITSVGEFHYLHHPPTGGRYDDPDELAVRVHRAAAEVGIELVLLRVAYARAGHGRQAEPRQVRFVDESVDESLAAVERLRARGIRCGLAPHSVRAVPLPWIVEMGAYAESHELPFHMHVSEQPREIEECLAEHGKRPVELLGEAGLLGPRFTGVHGIHLSPDEIRHLGETRSNVCACPTTERNLGDGAVPAKELLDAGVTISFGTDSQAEIAPLQDARSLEYHLRLERLERAVLARPGGDASMGALADRLLQGVTTGGARSLGLPTGRIAPGAWADLVAVDLDDPSICGPDPEAWSANVVFSLERTAIREVWARGRQIVAEGRHQDAARITRDFRDAMARLWG